MANHPAPEVADQRGIDPSIYGRLASHQVSEEWAGKETMAFLQGWAEKFIVEFKLDIPSFTLRVDKLPANCYGQFRYGHNGLGLRREIAINAIYLTGKRPAYSVLATLLHELLHAWQETHGTPGDRNHHNREFRDKAAEVGLIVDENGVTGLAGESRFKELLMDSGIVVPVEEIPPVPRKERGDSKLKKWTCGCTNVRVAVKEFRARCLACGNEFHRDDTSGPAKHRRLSTKSQS
jgi:hypothetical protein